MEMNILSRLAMLKISDNVRKRFSKAQKLLKGNALNVAKAIRDDDRKNKIAKSLLEWAECELGVSKQLKPTNNRNGGKNNDNSN